MDITKRRLRLSIHGRDESGKQPAGVYNPNPQPQQEPRTKRGLRRRASKGKK